MAKVRRDLARFSPWKRRTSESTRLAPGPGKRYLLARWHRPAGSPTNWESSPGPARWWSGWADHWTRQRVASRYPTEDGPIIVSVGNLALGGTGKTPVIMGLARDLAHEGFFGAILTRVTRARWPVPVEVTTDLLLAGDEARLLSQALQPEGWLVVQARNRWVGMLHLLQLGQAPGFHSP